MGVRVSWGVGVEFGSSSSILGWSMGMFDVWASSCVVGEGFHALYWKMSSCFMFGCWMRALRVLRWARVVRDARGGCMVGFLRVVGLLCAGWESLWGGGIIVTSITRKS